MKIKVTEERECCQHRDLKPVHGAPMITGTIPEFMFCVHCGKRHAYDSFMDPAGSRDWDYKPVPEQFAAARRREE